MFKFNHQTADQQTNHLIVFFSQQISQQYFLSQLFSETNRVDQPMKMAYSFALFFNRSLFRPCLEVKTFLKLVTVALSFVFGNYYPTRNF